MFYLYRSTKHGGPDHYLGDFRTLNKAKDHASTQPEGTYYVQNGKPTQTHAAEVVWWSEPDPLIAGTHSGMYSQAVVEYTYAPDDDPLYKHDAATRAAREAILAHEAGEIASMETFPTFLDAALAWIDRAHEQARLAVEEKE